MDTMSFWDEEMRSFPHGSGGIALWVVRREGQGQTAPLKVLYTWATGKARMEGMAVRPPLSKFLHAMNQRKEELSSGDQGKALWVEPLVSGSRVRGCLGMWFQADGPWRESVFLWAQRLAARLIPVLDQLDTMPTMFPGGGVPWQPTLFPLPEARVSEGKILRGMAAKLGLARGREIPFPRPVTIAGIPGCVGVSEEMKLIGQRLGSIAQSDVNVMLNGESGTGKEIIAQALHLRSSRAQGPFVGQNCAALPEALFESELFGHKSGSFTGAQGDKQGLLASASGGTFFLDEIGDMHVLLQIKLL